MSIAPVQINACDRPFKANNVKSLVQEDSPMSILKKADLIIAALVISVAQFAAAADASGSPQVEIQTGSGSITVRTGSSDRINIEARIKANDSWGWFGGDNRLSAEERVKRLEANPPIEQHGNTVVIGRIEDSELRNVS